MRMYSLAELHIVRGDVEQDLAAKAENLEKKRQTRLERMVRVHNISPASHAHRALFEHIFGDYMSAPHPKKRLKEKRYRLLARCVCAPPTPSAR